MDLQYRLRSSLKESFTTQTAVGVKQGSEGATSLIPMRSTVPAAKAVAMTTPQAHAAKESAIAEAARSAVHAASIMNEVTMAEVTMIRSTMVTVETEPMPVIEIAAVD